MKKVRAPARTGLLIGARGVAAVTCALVLGAGHPASASPAAAAAASPASAPAATAAAQAAPCAACHGAHGEGMPAAHVPRIAGQSADYLQKQLDDYAAGTRDNPIMGNFAKALSEPERAKFASLYAAMPASAVAQAVSQSAAQLARGHQLAYQGDEGERVQACNGCHGPDGSGVPHAAPYLAGQSAEYLASALKSFAQGSRKNDAGQLMRSVAERLNDADIAAVSGYFAGLGTAKH